MKTILVVDDDKMILRLAGEALKDYAEGFNVKTALNGKLALQILNSSAIDLVLTDLKMPQMDGYQLLSTMSRDHKEIPVIVMTGFGSPEIAKRLKERGVLHYIEKPFEINVLRQKISDVFAATSKGSIRGFTLANFLQAVEVEQKTTTLRVRSKHKTGYLHLENGELIDAETDGKNGEAAAIEIICWDNTEIEMQGLLKRESKIDASLMQILLEASRIKDEEGEKDDRLEHAVFMAEGHHFKKAQGILSEFLKEQANRKNHIGWLWFSRIIVSMKSVETALRNAAKLAPRDYEVVEEVKKFNLARKQIKTPQIKRCPFCWTPMDPRTIQCVFCKGFITVHSKVFTSQRDANPGIMEKAIERYVRILGNEKNINAYYYLSLAHLNMEHWEEALNLFHKMVNMEPDKKLFTEQLRLLLNNMASHGTAIEMDNRVSQDARDAEDKTGAGDGPEVKKIPKVLVVEDSSTTRKVISITLGQKGYEIIEARDGLEAFSRLNEGPDLILLDIILPNMDGYKILEFIRKNPRFKDIPVIMLTSKDGMINRLKGKMAGATAYLTKPFDPKKLVETIEKYIKMTVTE